jgi:hypothetical protein
MIIGIGLGWPTAYDPDSRMLVGKEYDSIYLEDPAILLMYEGRGIRQILLQEREKAAKAAGYRYSLAYISEDIPTGSVTDYITESGSQLERLYLKEEYEFFKTDKGVLAVKILKKVSD